MTVTGSCKKVTAVSELASTHPYSNNSADSWVYTLSGASALNVKFSAETEVEDEFDFLYIYDKSGKQIGRYTGKELAGKTISIQGDTVRIKLVSDSQGNAYGFAVESVMKAAAATYPVTEVSFNYPSSLYVGKTYSPTVSISPGNASNKALNWKSSNPSVVSVNNSTGAISVKAAGTATITATAHNGVKCSRTLSARMVEGQYVGNINSELISFDLKQAENGAYYLTGQIVVVEWIDGKSTVPREAPVMTFKSTDGKESIEVFVTPTGTNTYYFDRFIEGFSAGREYVFEIASGDGRNVSPNRSMNVSLATSPKMVRIKNLGKIGKQKLSYYMASNGELRLYRRTEPYVGNINSQLMKTALVTGPNGNYVSGEIVVVEWEDGISTVPFETPVMYFKSTDGKESLPVWVTPTGTNTYYFDRSLGDLDTSKEYVFTIESGDNLNVSRYRSMTVTTTDMPSKEGTLWESPKQYVRYRTDSNTGQLRIYGINK